MTTDPIHPRSAPDRLVSNDLHGLSAKELESSVARMCSAYGTVVKVAVHVSHAHLQIRAFALVDMAEPAEAERLAAAFGRRTVGTAVLLLLEPGGLERA